MLTLQNVYIDTLDVDSMTIHWEIQSTNENINLYHIDFYRAEAPGDIAEFDLVASGIDAVDGYYVDTTINKMSYSINRKIYYYLKVIETSSGVNKDFGPYVMSTSPDYVALEIIRRKNIVLNNSRYGARTFNILKKRTWGNYCPTCFDPITQRIQDPMCLTCYGTGIDGGYFNPIEIKGFRSDKSYKFLLNLFGTFEESDVSFVLQGRPILNVNDVIVDELNNRYKILSPVRHTEKGMYIIEQQIRVMVISPSDIIYKVPV